jgi:hypothetical protein
MMTDPQGWERVCAITNSADNGDVDVCIGVLRERLSRTGALMRALKHSMFDSSTICTPGDHLTLVEIALEEIDMLDSHEQGSIPDVFERNQHELKQRVYQQLRHSEAHLKAAEAMSAALSPDSGIAGLDAAARTIWPYVETGMIDPAFWDNFCRAVRDRGLEVYMYGVPESQDPGVMTPEKAEALRKNGRAAERFARRIMKLNSLEQRGSI